MATIISNTSLFYKEKNLRDSETKTRGDYSTVCKRRREKSARVELKPQQNGRSEAEWEPAVGITPADRTGWAGRWGLVELGFRSRRQE